MNWKGWDTQLGGCVEAVVMERVRRPPEHADEEALATKPVHSDEASRAAALESLSVRNGELEMGWPEHRL